MGGICITARRHYILICHERLDMMRELVIKARAADHAPFLINEARQKLSGMNIELEPLGA